MTRRPLLHRPSDGRAGARGVVASGARAGIAAAVVMAVVMMIASAASGRGAWTPIRLVAALVFGADWLGSPVASAALGMVVHLALGVLWGVIFVGLTQRVESALMTFMLGLLYATGIYVFTSYAVLPALDPATLARLDPGRFFIAHVFYGAVLALIVGWARSRPAMIAGTRRKIGSPT